MIIENKLNGLLLTTFPFMTPRHGGQIRMSKTFKYLNEHGHNLISIAFYEPGVYSKSTISKNDIALPYDNKWMSFCGFNSALINDHITGEYVYDRRDFYFNLIKNKLPKHLDYIYVEHPWLFKFGKFIQKKLNQEVKFFLGYPNVESILKQSILDSYKIKGYDEIISNIHFLEIEAIKNSDLVFIVSKKEKIFCKKYTKINKLIYSRNGYEPLKPICENSLKKLKKKLPEKFIFYIGSGHPPNFSNLCDFLGDALGFLPPDVKFVVAGGVSDHVYSAFTKDENFLINQSRLLLLGDISEVDLNTIRQLAHIIVLPIGYGGGSALKTSEALSSKCYVVSNDVGLRDFEQFIDNNKVYLCNDKDSFTSTIAKLLLKNRCTQKAPVELSWDNQMKIVDENIKRYLK